MSVKSVVPDAMETRVGMTSTHAMPEVQKLEFSREGSDEPLRVLARALGRQAARQHLARGNSIAEIAAALAIVAIFAAAAKWLLP
jgi:hypothetical protein